jgi:CRP/FNR family transcriptional regulator, cyclic AMP receptor protein
MAVSSVDVLATVPLLKGVERRDLERLSRELKPRTFAAGQKATEEGQGGVAFWIILSGTASVSVGGTPRPSLGPGDFFGEMALLSETGVRTATVTAETDLECVGLTVWEFKPFLQEHPEAAWRILNTMAERQAATG